MVRTDIENLITKYIRVGCIVLNGSRASTEITLADKHLSFT